jgi:hypothetical protein
VKRAETNYWLQAVLSCRRGVWDLFVIQKKKTVESNPNLTPLSSFLRVTIIMLTSIVYP